MYGGITRAYEDAVNPRKRIIMGLSTFHAQGRVSRKEEINQNGGSSSQEVSYPWPYQMAFWAMLGFQYGIFSFSRIFFSVTWIHYFVLLAP